MSNATVCIRYTRTGWPSFGRDHRRNLKWGINGFFDRGLGVRYNSYEERDAICKARGVVPLDDMPKYYLEDHNEKAMKYEKYLDDRADAYWEGAKACKDIKDQERFWEEYCPAKPALDGEYTKTIDDF